MRDRSQYENVLDLGTHIVSGGDSVPALGSGAAFGNGTLGLDACAAAAARYGVNKVGLLL